VTVYNFYGLVEGSAKSPTGWEFSSEEFGRTPTLNGYPMVLPVDVPNTPNLTWVVTKPVAAGAQIDGFTATTRVSAMVLGQYTAQITRQLPAIQGAAGTPSVAGKGVQTGAHRRAPDAELPCGREVTSPSLTTEVASSKGTRRDDNHPARAKQAMAMKNGPAFSISLSGSR
jgi:hypothetical protein